MSMAEGKTIILNCDASELEKRIEQIIARQVSYEIFDLRVIPIGDIAKRNAQYGLYRPENFSPCHCQRLT